MSTIAIRNLSFALVAALSVGTSSLSTPAVAAIASVKQEAPSKPRIEPESVPVKPQVAPQSTPTPQPSSCRRVNTSGIDLNVRDTPAGNIIGTLPDLTVVTIDNRGANGWVPISAPQRGYVFASYLTNCDEPIVERPPATSFCRRVAAKEGMPVRQNPSLNSAVLGSLIDGQEITIVNRGSNGWVPISSPINGYVLAVGLVMCN
ncbi:MAG TPA: SH3 domain-containing protein [Oscillatoriales cyanobacterium M59_W2019_021]|nr:MAG: SH3 domain-containing protein [Cyanobacteria bacterium J055]HIK31743.1 SH3 domain-containing protein [Oscillatoriales cyanobacterium M4454_W2019_049]HIK50601.1 SH3 domain-containing protein [Oscillatoriales cyanobacterium M59_W2019_021]